jgi:hypothetical protein
LCGGKTDAYVYQKDLPTVVESTIVTAIHKELRPIINHIVIELRRHHSWAGKNEIQNRKV